MPGNVLSQIISTMERLRAAFPRAGVKLRGLVDQLVSLAVLSPREHLSMSSIFAQVHSLALPSSARQTLSL